MFGCQFLVMICSHRTICDTKRRMLMPKTWQKVLSFIVLVAAKTMDQCVRQMQSCVNNNNWRKTNYLLRSFIRMYWLATMRTTRTEHVIPDDDDDDAFVANNFFRLLFCFRFPMADNLVRWRMDKGIWLCRGMENECWFCHWCMTSEKRKKRDVPMTSLNFMQTPSEKPRVQAPDANDYCYYYLWRLSVDGWLTEFQYPKCRGEKSRRGRKNTEIRSNKKK